MKKKWKCFVLDELPQIATKTMTFYDKIRQKKNYRHYNNTVKTALYQR